MKDSDSQFQPRQDSANGRDLGLDLIYSAWLGSLEDPGSGPASNRLRIAYRDAVAARERDRIRAERLARERIGLDKQ